MTAMAENTPQKQSSSSSNFAGTFLTVANSIFVILALGWCTLVGMLPLLLVSGFVHDVTYYPLYLTALALSAPGIAALFAVFRDQPTLFSGNSALRAKVWQDHADEKDFPPDWIAQPYVDPNHNAAVIKPYFRAYARVFKRSLAMGFTFAVLAFCFLYNMQIFAQMPFGVYVTPMLAVCLVFLAQALLIALVLVVEYPKAKWLVTLKNAVMLSVRRFYMIFVSGIVLGAFGFALVTWSPILFLLLGTGVVGYMLWASARWQADKLFVLMANESKDKRIIDMYSAQSRGNNFFNAQSDWQQ
ncbi:hypothetical protein Tam10B_1613 [Bifidobacterium vansinderenii]|uniref:Uncharacterized protein n=2 Tax=Bifidobacterium vansinderenii TaxID=1984871 RepID=A0A229VWY8_9BIFI|nr:hypothetical protein Tam10B_1613 [Bifidobacterium vansinderenii]